MNTYTNWMRPQPNGPPGMGGDGGNLQMGQGPQPGAYFGNGTMDSPTPMAMGMMNAPVQQPQPQFNAGPGMEARSMASPQPVSMTAANTAQFSPRAPMPNGPMGGDTRYSPMAPAPMAPPQQFSPMAPAGQPPMQRPMPAQYSPMAPAQQPPGMMMGDRSSFAGGGLYRAQQRPQFAFNGGNSGGLFGFGGGR